MKNFYITTTLPYVNADPHIGFALEIVHADIVARYKRMLGDDVFFNFGTDEHGQKIYQNAKEAGKSPQNYVDEYAKKFDNLKLALNLSYNNFIRTTDAHHVKSAQEFWKRCEQNGDIYKKHYSVKYCVGCELEKTDSELEDGFCPLHPGKELELREEENYFFRFSKYQDKLLNLYKNNPDFVVPKYRLNEFVKLAEDGLQDFSISRLKEKMPWGVPVPGDDEHVMYVWFDALVNYISAIGWPTDMEKFEKWWPVVQFAGKDQVRMQCGMWQAMLMSAGLPPSKQIVIHGFVNSNGQKMSKSIGNVINPIDIVNEYGTDALRYYIAREFSPFEDSDITMEKFNIAYNANLANGIGNLTSRIMKMAEDNLNVPIETKQFKLPEEFKSLLDKYEIQKSADFVWEKIAKLDGYIQKTEPFKLVKENPEKAKKIITELVQSLHEISILLTPFLPNTAGKIGEAIKENKKPEILFERKN